MGTRADFYVGRGENAEWIGSIALDGYPSGIPDHVLSVESEIGYRKYVKEFVSGNNGRLPKDGWPWPWEDSQTTDYAYALDGEKVYASCFGHVWFDPKKSPEPEDYGDKVEIFPNMKEVQKVTDGGFILFTAPSTH